jgi:hypothetical protein
MKFGALTAVVAVAGSLLVAAPQAASGTGCLPEAQVPSRDRSQAQAWAYLPCGGTGFVRLVTSGGVNLSGDQPFSGGSAGYASGSWTTCTGYSVHTFVYVNINGTGMSDTSGSVSC